LNDIWFACLPFTLNGASFCTVIILIVAKYRFDDDKGLSCSLCMQRTSLAARHQSIRFKLMITVYTTSVSATV